MLPALGTFRLPHDIALDERGQRAFVADRENARVQAFDIGDGMKRFGTPRWEIRAPELLASVYSAHFHPSECVGGSVIGLRVCLTCQS